MDNATMCHCKAPHDSATSADLEQLGIVLLLFKDGLSQPRQLALPLFDCLGAQPTSHAMHTQVSET